MERLCRYCAMVVRSNGQGTIWTHKLTRQRECVDEDWPRRPVKTRASPVTYWIEEEP